MPTRPLILLLLLLTAAPPATAYITSFPFSVGVQTSQSCSAAGGSGCGAGNTGRQTRVNSLDAQYQSRDRAQLTRATVGEGTVLVRRDGETGTDSTAGLNRDLSLAQQLIRDDATDYDLYYSDSSVSTVTHTFTGQGADLIDTLRPDLIVAEVTGSAILGLNDIDNAFHDALTLNLSGDPAQNRGLLDDGRTADLSKSVESRIKAGASGLQLYQNDAGEWRFIGQDTTYDERYAAHMGGRALSDTTRVNERAINNITDDSEGTQTRSVLQEVVRQAAGTSDTRLVLFDDEAASLAAGAKGYYSEQHNQAGLNVAAVDMANPREVMETVAHEGRHGQTAGSSDSEEALSTLYGRETGYQWARSNQREGSHVGGYDGNSSEEWRQNAGVSRLVSQGNAQTAQVHPAQMDFRQLHPMEVDFLADRDRVQRYMTHVSKATGGMRVLAEDDARQELNRYAAAYLDEDWSAKYGGDAVFETFLKAEAKTADLYYTDKHGDRKQLFSWTKEEYQDPTVNLKALFGAYGTNSQIKTYVADIQNPVDNAQALTMYQAGRQAGYQAASDDAGLWADAATLGKGVIGLPGYLIDSAGDEDIGPLDSQQMSSYYDSLLRLQGDFHQAGFISQYSESTADRLMWMGLPAAEATALMGSSILRAGVGAYRGGVPDSIQARHLEWAGDLGEVSGSIERLGQRALRQSGGDARKAEQLFEGYLGGVENRLSRTGGEFGIEIQPAALAGGERVPGFVYLHRGGPGTPLISDGAGNPRLFAYPGSRRLDAGVVDLTMPANQHGLHPLAAGFDITLNASKRNIVPYYQQNFGEIPIYDIRLP